MSGPIMEVLLFDGTRSVIDQSDWAEVRTRSWHRRKAKNTSYAESGSRANKTSIHRMILRAPKGVMVDHIDGDGLNNRRDNLRLCDRGQNRRNSKKPDGCSSRFKGVTKLLDTKEPLNPKRWQAGIKVAGKSIFLGYFKSETDAAIAYDAAAMKHFGEFARTNASVWILENL